DVMGERVSYERDDADEAPAQAPLEMLERDLVVPSQRRVGETGGDDRASPAQRRDRLQRIDDLARRMRTQLPVEQKGRESDGRQSDEGPKTLLPSFHALASVAWAVNRLKRWRPAGARRRSTAVGLRGSHRGQAAHAAEVEPDVGVVLRLPFEVGVAGGVPGADVVGEVVEDELAAIGLDGEDGMA